MRNETSPVEMLRRAIKEAGTQARLAEQWGVSQAYISDMLNKRRGFSDAVLARLGLRRVVVKEGA